VAGPGSAISPDDEPDLTPPPTPTGFTVGAAISNIFIGHDAPLYPQGHGHAKTVVYGATRATGAPLPVFSDAVPITEFSGTVFAHPTNPATTWHLWIKWVSVDGVYSAAPAGGTNGLVATTGQDVSLLLTALSGKITESALFSALGARIDLIDGVGAGSVNARVAVESAARSDETGALFAQYTVKTDVAGLVSGYGLASTVRNAAPTSAFGVRANSFFVAPPAVAQSTAPTVNLYDGYVWLDTSVTPNVTRYRSGAAWVLNSPVLPFVIQTTPTTINGVAVPAGVYANDLYVKNGTITNAKIGDLAVDDAKVFSLSVAKLIAGSLSVGQYAQSTGYVANTSGWRINGDGTAEFSGVVVRGTIYATAGQIGGINITGASVRSANYDGVGNGFALNANGTLDLPNGSVKAAYIDARGLSIKDGAGNIILAAGTALNWKNIAPVNVNLAPSLMSWVFEGAGWRSNNSWMAEDQRSLVLPSGGFSLGRTPLVSLVGSGAFTVSFRANAASARTLTIDLFPDTLPEASVALSAGLFDYSVTLPGSYHPDLNNCVLRFFSTGTGQVEISDIKLEYGSTKTAWVAHETATVGVNNPVT
jgi:hypothetical protein